MKHSYLPTQSASLASSARVSLSHQTSRPDSFNAHLLGGGASGFCSADDAGDTWAWTGAGPAKERGNPALLDLRFNEQRLGLFSRFDCIQLCLGCLFHTFGLKPQRRRPWLIGKHLALDKLVEIFLTTDGNAGVIVLNASCRTVDDCLGSSTSVGAKRILQFTTETDARKQLRTTSNVYGPDFWTQSKE